MVNKKLIVIVGPTAVGKTRLAVLLARQLKTEIISADSRQIYREMEIGTAKPTKEDLKEVKHHFVSIRSVSETYDAGQYGREASAAILHLFESHDTVILCGGSGLYVRAVCEGFDDLPEADPQLREKIMAEYDQKGLSWLQESLRERDPEYFSVVDRLNPHRLVRALELTYATGKHMSELRKRKKFQHPYAIVKIGLALDRSELYHRIDTRIDQMVDTGLFEEVRMLCPEKNRNALQTVGYQEIFSYYDGLYDREEAIRLVKRNSRHYAKRQMTWFKKDTEITWFKPDQFDEIRKFVMFQPTD